MCLFPKKLGQIEYHTQYIPELFDSLQKTLGQICHDVLKIYSIELAIEFTIIVKAEIPQRRLVAMTCFFCFVTKRFPK